MHHGEVDACVVMHQRAVPEPVNQFIKIRRLYDIMEGIAGMVYVAMSIGDSQQVQVMVTQHSDCIVTQVPDESQRFEVSRATVDDVSDKPELVLVGIKLY